MEQNEYKKSYEALYKELLMSYEKGEFEETYNRILNEAFENPLKAQEVLSILCGVELESYDRLQHVSKIKEAIIGHRIRKKIIQKVGACDSDCETVEGKSKCQSVCPFDAIIKKEGSHEKWIDDTLCMSCGRCVRSCPSINYIDTPQGLPVLDLLKQQEKVVAIVAPAISGQFGKDVTLEQLREAFIKAGFLDMLEVAVAADVLSIKESYEYNHHVHKQGDFMITSCCCPMWVGLLKKVYSNLVKDVSPSVSPMIAMARIIKKLNPEVKVVFIGPCISKKAEAREKELLGAVDYVLTFEEVSTLFEVLDIQPASYKGIPTVDYASEGGRLYARTGGVSKAIGDIVKELFPEKSVHFDTIKFNGIKECKAGLEALQKGEIKANFIEGMGCVGGCVGGPKVIVDKEQGRACVDEVAYASEIRVPIYSEVVKGILKQLDINDVQELVEKGSLFERDFNYK